MNKFIEQESYEKGFSDYFEKTLWLAIQRYEDSRVGEILNAFVLVVLVFFMTFISTDLDVSWRTRVSIFVTIIFIIISIFGVNALDGRRFKRQIVSKVLRFYKFGEYSFKERTRLQFLKNKELAVKFEGFTVDDYFFHYYDKVKIHMAELRREVWYAWTKVRFISIKIDKRFKGETFVFKNWKNKGVLRKMFLLNSAGLTLDSQTYKPVNLEYSKFEDLFEVYGSDQVESRYLLTPSFMQRLVDLIELKHVDRMNLVFDDGWLTIYFTGKKGFFDKKGSIFKSLADMQDIKNILKDVNMTHVLVDTLNLDKQISL